MLRARANLLLIGLARDAEVRIRTNTRPPVYFLPAVRNFYKVYRIIKIVDFIDSQGLRYLIRSSRISGGFKCNLKRFEK